MNTTEVWQKPPNIQPNLGRRRSLMPRSRLPRVILHDNASQQQLLDIRLDIIASQRQRAQRLFGLHRKSFIVQQSLKQKQLRNAGIDHVGFLPETIARAHWRAAEMLLEPMAENGTHQTDEPDIPKRDHHEEMVPHYVAQARLKMNAKSTSKKSKPNPLSRSLTAHPLLTKVGTFHSEPRREVTLVMDTPDLRDVLRDHRYEMLTESLVNSEFPTEGFLHLSDSGRSVLEQCGGSNVDASVTPKGLSSNLVASYRRNYTEFDLSAKRLNRGVYFNTSKQSERDELIKQRFKPHIISPIKTKESQKTAEERDIQTLPKIFRTLNFKENE